MVSLPEGHHNFDDSALIRGILGNLGYSGEIWQNGPEFSRIPRIPAIHRNVVLGGAVAGRCARDEMPGILEMLGILEIQARFSGNDGGFQGFQGFHVSCIRELFSARGGRAYSRVLLASPSISASDAARVGPEGLTGEFA